MNTENTTTQTPAATLGELEDLIGHAILAMADDGIHLVTRDAETLLDGISHHYQAAAELRELARLIEAYGQAHTSMTGEVSLRSVKAKTNFGIVEGHWHVDRGMVVLAYGGRVKRAQASESEDTNAFVALNMLHGLIADDLKEEEA